MQLYTKAISNDVKNKTIYIKDNQFLCSRKTDEVTFAFKVFHIISYVHMQIIDSERKNKIMNKPVLFDDEFVDKIVENNFIENPPIIHGLCMFNAHKEMSKLYQHYGGTLFDLTDEMLEEWKNTGVYSEKTCDLRDDENNYIGTITVLKKAVKEKMISKLSKIYKSLSEDAKILLKVSEEDYSEIENLGCEKTEDGKLYITEDYDIEKYQKWIPLTIELVPKYSWYKNLRDALDKSDWNKLRKETYKKYNYRCSVCNGKGEKHPVECHEIWKYDDHEKIQYLDDLVALCPKCHRVKHIGLAGVHGVRGRAIAHMSRVNGWTLNATRAYVSHSFDIWSQRSLYDWNVDVSKFESEHGIKLDILEEVKDDYK